MRSLIPVAVALLTLPWAASAQSGISGTPSLSLSSGSGVRGGPVVLQVALSASSPAPAGVQWTLRYSPQDLSVVAVTTGPAAAVSRKTVYCSAGAGTYTCVAAGVNSNWIAGGIIATVVLTISPTTPSAASQVDLLGPAASTPDGAPLPLSVSGNLVAISSPPATSLRIATAGLPGVPANSVYQQTLSATGGQPPYQWSVAGGTLPDGLALSATTGTLSGTLAARGNFGFVIEVRDSAGFSSSRAFAVSVFDSGLALEAVVNGASFQSAISPGSWITLLGSGFTSTSRSWMPDELIDGHLPTQLDNVGVTIGGKPAFLAYISPTQINALAPADAILGSLTVQLVTDLIPGPSLDIQVTALAPAFFMWPGNYVVATHADSSPAVKAGEFADLATTPARPGEVIMVWGTGFGPTSPAVAAGTFTPSGEPYSASLPFGVNIGGLAASGVSARLAPGQAGVYWISAGVPVSAPAGDLPVTIVIGGTSYSAGGLLTVQR